MAKGKRSAQPTTAKGGTSTTSTTNTPAAQGQGRGPAQPTATPTATPQALQPLPATPAAAALAHYTSGGRKPARSRVNRQTGTRIVLLAPLPGHGTWVTHCAGHSHSVATWPTRKTAKDACYVPATWCPGCSAKHQAAAQAAAQAVAAAQAQAQGQAQG